MAKPTGPGSRALRKGRYSQQNGIYFITAVTDQRIPWFQQFSLARILCRILEDSDVYGKSSNLCWVVMPDHLHMLLQLGETELGSVVRSLKARSALALNREMGRTGRFWAPGYHDHGLRKNENVRKIARYIVANPLRAGLVTSVAHYPFWNATWL